MRKFERNRSYSRSEIHNALGGSVQWYLPTVRNAVVAGCFRRDTNPDAPAIVLPGNGPAIRKSAELFASSPESVPVFIKHGVNDWRYVGDYCVTKLSQDPSEIRVHAQRAGRNDVSCVLHLSKVR
jgi:Domain of unknown function (DUF6697)